MERAEALAALVSTARSYAIHRSRTPSVRPPSTSMRDEAYVLDLCDQVLSRTSSRQHRFPFLLGDAGHRLPVDAYYPDLSLVIEYRERQHVAAHAFFDRRDTVSGVPRGAQRALYDERRRIVLPQQGIQLIEFNVSDFPNVGLRKLKRDQKQDLKVIRARLAAFL